MLHREDYELLCNLVDQEGRIQIADGDDKRSGHAKRLVELGYAETPQTGIRSIALEVTQKGRVAKVLADFDIWNSDFCAIEPQPVKKPDQWLIKVTTVGRPPALIDIETANQLVSRLIEVGATNIALQFQAEIERTCRYLEGRLRAEIR
jgi:hypothetical protein